MTIQKLQVLSNNSFKGLHSLKQLLLTYSGITSLPSRLLYGLDSLEQVDLSHNQLVSIDFDLLLQQKLLVLDITNNTKLSKANVLNATTIIDLKVVINTDNSMICCMLGYKVNCTSPEELHWCGEDFLTYQPQFVITQSLFSLLLNITSLVLRFRQSIKGQVNVYCLNHHTLL